MLTYLVNKIYTAQSFPLTNFHKPAIRSTQTYAKDFFQFLYNVNCNSNYHCSSACGVRFKATYGNNWGAEEIKKYIPKYDPVQLYVDLLLNALHKHSSPKQDKRKSLFGEINSINEQLSRARKMVLEGVFDTVDFIALIMDSEKKIGLLESKLPEISQSIGSLPFYLGREISNINHTDIQSDNKKTSKRGI